MFARPFSTFLCFIIVFIYIQHQYVDAAVLPQSQSQPQPPGAHSPAGNGSPTVIDIVQTPSSTSRTRKKRRSSSRGKIVSQSNQSSKTKPFSVKIGDVSFYGGLVTYTHALHPARICRIFNGCVKSDGTLLLPEWMQRHDEIISFHCGHNRVEFSLNDTYFPFSSTMNDDLIGIPPAPHPSMPFFISEFMPSAVIFDLMYGAHERVSRACHSRRGESCEGFPGLDSLKAMVVLPDRLGSIELKKSWPKQFVNLMKPPGTGRQPNVMYESGLFDRADQETEGEGELFNDMKCFRSVMFTRGPFNKNTIMNDHLQNIHFLTMHGIDRNARKIWSGGNKEKSANDQDPNNQFAKYQIDNTDAFSDRMCTINITIANRDPTNDKNRLVGRYIPNVNNLRNAILQQAEKIPRLSVNVQSLTLEGKTLRWQMNAMQKTDILVGAHGPLLTNMIFLRENTSSVIEIQPFSYYPNTYEKMAQYVAHISHQRYIAHPDYNVFHACISQMFPASHPFRVEALDIMRKFALAVDKYRQSDSTHTFVLHGLKTDDNENNRKVIACAKMQRLDSHANKLAIAIIRTARLTCGLPLPTTRARGLVATV